MKNGTIVCRCGHIHNRHLGRKRECTCMTANNPLSVSERCRCQKYSPRRVKVVWIGISESMTVTGNYATVLYCMRAHKEIKWHRVEILVQIKTKTGKGEK